MTTTRCGAVILVGPERSSAVEQLMDRALRAAALALADRLRAVGVAPVILAGPGLGWLPPDASVQPDADSAPFHFGTRLSNLIEQHALSPLFYFGAGSAPLLREETLAAALAALQDAERGGAALLVTNNVYSSDWLGISCASRAVPIMARAARDNGLAWSLREEAGYRVEIAPAPDAAAQLDLDTPSDLAIVREHPGCPPGLRAALDDSRLARIPVRAMLDLLGTDGSRLALLGRVAPVGWQALSRAARCWIRAYSEERGMAASERLAYGEVRSLIEVLLRALGPQRFFEELSMMVDGAIIDTRVLIAAAGRTPSAADRFASDLLQPDLISDEWLRDFTGAAARAPIPLLLGGHGVVSGGLFTLAEITGARRAKRQEYQ